MKIRQSLFVLMTSVAAPGWAQGDSNKQDDEIKRKVSDVTLEEDPYLWLEEVAGDRALAWVRQQNQATRDHFESSAAFSALRDDLLEIFDSDERIPFIGKSGDYYYNFWRDKDHVRGIWRRTTLDEYRRQDPKWDILLDLDRLAADEGENWVWGGASLLRPDYDLALISLSRGGADASVTREFSLQTRQFVADGFHRAQAKGDMSWIDRDSVFIFTDFGEGTMTTSGYPRIVKLWRRGTPLDKAEIVYEGKPEDLYISASHDDSPGFARNFVQRTLAFYNDEMYLRSDDGQLRKIDVPNSAEKRVVREYLLLTLREPWKVGGRSYRAGSLLVIRFADFMAGDRNFSAAFEPAENTSLAEYSLTKNHMLLNVLEDVKNRVYVLTPEGDTWRRRPLRGAPAIGTVIVGPADPDESDEYWMISSGYLTPTALSLGEIGRDPERLKQLTPMYDAEGLQVSQHFVTSRDGTRVPYFMVANKDIELNGDNPTLLYGYGGFEIPLVPGYAADVGRAWTSQGGVYVVANIRGGGEYGPRWHQAALKENRLRSYEDFAAVAEDLLAREITRKDRLGVQGGSNGGLLVGNMIALYPDLFAAAVCQVPLLDMRRYHLLLAGASWMAEYGDPDAQGEWEFIKTFSPYHNIKASVNYPAVLFTTSTRDDRVHPGHARKMMALMHEQGHDVTYFENIEGGHGGGANNQQQAYMEALAYSFLRERLFRKE